MKVAARFSLRLISPRLSLIRPAVSDAQALRPGDDFPGDAERCEEEGRGRPMREDRLMATPYRPRPEDSRREGSLSEE